MQQQLEGLAMGSWSIYVHRKRQRALHICVCVSHSSYWANQHVPFKMLVSVVLWSGSRKAFVRKRHLSPSQVFLHSLLPHSGRPLDPLNVLLSKKFSVPTSSCHTQWGLFVPMIARLSPVFCLLPYPGFLLLAILP